MNRSKVAEKEACHRTPRKFTSYLMGMQVPRGLDPEVSEEGSMRPTSEGSEPHPSQDSLKWILRGSLSMAHIP